MRSPPITPTASLNSTGVNSLTSTLISRLREKAFALGFDHFGVTPARIPERDQAAYLEWSAKGNVGTMDYMTRDPQRRVDLSLAYPGIQSVVTLGVSYYQGPLPEKPSPAHGRVARYAWGLDYHDVIGDRLQRLMVSFAELLDGSKAVLAVDTKPLLERALAQGAGLGFMGKNTVMILPRPLSLERSGFHIGSFVFLGEILLELPLDADPAPSAQAALGGCGGCTKCLDACPTDAFEKPYSLRADRCIAYLTIENKGEIPVEMRPHIKDWIFGCDVCQDVCPFNARAYETRWPEFQAGRGAGPWVSLYEVFSLTTNESFKRKWGATPFSRAKRRGILRNACVVAGNSGEKNLVNDLEPLLKDGEPLIRSHALWALEQLS